MSLADAFTALQRGDAEACLSILETIAQPEGPALARVHAYRAQALRRLGRVHEAEREIAAAIRTARLLGDVDGVRSLRELQASILGSVVAIDLARRQQAADRSLLAEPDALLDDDHRIRKAMALLDDGQADAARDLLGRIEGADVRTQVLRLLALARCGDAARHIVSAHRIADDAGDQNLITAVANAARAAGVTLEQPPFG